jgi:hypothetical protein
VGVHFAFCWLTPTAIPVRGHSSPRLRNGLRTVSDTGSGYDDNWFENESFSFMAGKAYVVGLLPADWEQVHWKIHGL